MTCIAGSGGVASVGAFSLSAILPAPGALGVMAEPIGRALGVALNALAGTLVSEEPLPAGPVLCSTCCFSADAARSFSEAFSVAKASSAAALIRAASGSGLATAAFMLIRLAAAVLH